MKKFAFPILVIVVGIFLYHMYGKEIKTKGLKRSDGTYFQHRVIGSIIAFIGIVILISKINPNSIVK